MNGHLNERKVLHTRIDRYCVLRFVEDYFFSNPRRSLSLYIPPLWENYHFVTFNKHYNCSVTGYKNCAHSYLLWFVSLFCFSRHGWSTGSKFRWLEIESVLFLPWCVQRLIYETLIHEYYKVYILVETNYIKGFQSKFDFYEFMTQSTD